MSKFTDCNGREWAVKLTMGLVADVKRQTGIDLSITDKSAGWAGLLYSDPAKFVEVLWTILAGQAGEMTPEQFGHLFDGPTLEAAGIALLDAMVTMYPRPGAREYLKRNLSAAFDRADQELIRRLEAVGAGDAQPPAEPTAAPPG